uniref:IST1-like protein n=1 Tax=Anthurium amnicola TaxID=1678845 RepID=A0A1D1YNQ6_9ARAE
MSYVRRTYQLPTRYWNYFVNLFLHVFLFLKPKELQEAVASIIYAAPRCSDLPELMQVKNLFSTKYRKEFVAAASELRPDSNVNRMIIEKLSVRAPVADVKLRVLKLIAQEFNVGWDSSRTEMEFRKKHEDLLEGLNSRMGASTTLVVQNSSTASLHKNGQHVLANNQNQGMQPHPAAATVVDQVPTVSSKSTSMDTEKIEFPVDNQSERQWRSTDVLEKARAAIASAERASAAARAAAKLVNVRVHHQTGNVKHTE